MEFRREDEPPSQPWPQQQHSSFTSPSSNVNGNGTVQQKSHNNVIVLYPGTKTPLQFQYYCGLFDEMQSRNQNQTQFQQLWNSNLYPSSNSSTSTVSRMSVNGEDDSGYYGESRDDLGLGGQEHYDAGAGMEDTFVPADNPGTGPTPVGEAISYDDPGWGELFDGWIACMGPTLAQEIPDSPPEQELTANLNLTWNVPITPNNVNDSQCPSTPDFTGHSSTDNHVPVIKQQKRWDYNCDVCGIWIDGGLRRLQDHKRKMHEMTCNCGETFTSKWDFDGHIRREGDAAEYIHLSYYNTAPFVHGLLPLPRTPKVPFECDYCDELFTNRAKAIKHRRVIHGATNRKSASTQSKPRAARAQSESRKSESGAARKRKKPTPNATTAESTCAHSHLQMGNETFVINNTVTATATAAPLPIKKTRKDNSIKAPVVQFTYGLGL